MTIERLAPDAIISQADIGPLLADSRLGGDEDFANTVIPYKSIFKSQRWEAPEGDRQNFSWMGDPSLPPASMQLPFQTCVSHSLARLAEFLGRKAGKSYVVNPELFHQCSLGRSCMEQLPSISDAVKEVLNRGMPTGNLTFQPGGTCNPSYPETAKVKQAWRLEDTDEVKRSIRAIGPMVAKIAAEPRFADVRDFSIYRDAGGARGLIHAVLIIGYDDLQSCWIIQNSYGQSWGHNGLGRIAYGHCRILECSSYSAFGLS